MKTNTIIQGDALTKLKELPDESINCVMTSPPYWALRDYGTATWEDGDINCKHEDAKEKSRFDYEFKETEATKGRKLYEKGSGGDAPRWKDKCPKCGAIKVDKQLGLESTFDEYINKLCGIFDEVKRVLRKDGTCWVNLGDSYAGNMGKKSGWTDNKLGFGKEEAIKKGVCLTKDTKIIHQLPQKCLVGIPARFQLEMVNRGWILRNVIIWHKPNCMPSSAKDRFTIDFEYVFFFVKNKKYWFETQYEKFANGSDVEYRKKLRVGKRYDLKKPYENNTPYSVQPREKEFVEYRNLPDIKYFSIALTKERIQLKLTIEEIERSLNSQAPHHWFSAESFPSVEDWKRLKELGFMLPEFDKMLTKKYKKSSEKKNAIEYGRNKRTVWQICPKPFKEAHFAVYPEELCETPIKSGCPKFVCVKCGEPLERFINPNVLDSVSNTNGKYNMQTMREENSQVRRPQEDKTILQQKMQSNLDSTTQEEYNIQNENIKGLHSDISTNSPKCTKVGIHSRTQVSDGKEVGEILKERRNSASLEWDKGRQQDTEFSDDENEHSQPNNKKGKGGSTNNMSSLSQKNKSFLPCKKCGSDKIDSGVVLDCFFGAGTTGLVALKQNKKFIGIELSKEYIQIANKRLKPYLEQRKL